MKRLRDRVAIVTGASRGIGVRIAEALAREGSHVAVSARSASELDAVRERLVAIGVRAIAVPGDVTDASHRAELVARTEAELGPVDVLVNNAGIATVGHFHRTPHADLQRTIEVNLVAPMLLTSQVLPTMLERRSGHVVNMASGAGKLGPLYLGAYAASKHGLVGITHSLRAEYRRSGVGFSVVCPGFVTETGMYARWEDHGVRSGRLAGTCTPQHVVAATLRCIRRNRAEATINTPPVRPFIVLASIAPGLAPMLFERVGFTATLRRAAELDA
jgi:short-subunit dehydrogenase